MTFKVHITHRHVEKFGHNNEHYEYDEPCDDFINIEVDDERVQYDVAEMIYEEYFCKTFSGICPTAYYGTSRDKMMDAIKRLIDDLDAWDSVIEMYEDDLRDKYEEEYDDE